MNKTFSISEAISFGWKTFKSDWKFWLISFFLAGMGGIGTVGGSSFGKNLETQNNKISSLDTLGLESVLGASTSAATNLPVVRNMVLILGVVLPVMLIVFAVIVFSILVSTVLKMGYVNLTLDAARGKQVYYKTLLNQVSLKKSYRFLVANFLMGVLVFFGMIFFIVPGVILGLKYMFVGTALVDGDLTVKESFKKSSEVTKGIRTKLLGLLLALFVILIFSGLLTLGIGLIVMSVVSSLSLSYVYVKMSDSLGQDTTPVESPAPDVIPSQ